MHICGGVATVIEMKNYFRKVGGESKIGILDSAATVLKQFKIRVLVF